MATVNDVAAYILQIVGSPVTTMKLQKLVYYSQAWSLAWDGKPLFHEPIEAWDNGPVVRPLWVQHRGARHVKHMATGVPSVLSQEQIKTIRAVVEFYGKRDAEWLSELTHREDPWRRARAGAPPHAQSRAEIDHNLIRDFYGQQAKTLGQTKKFPANYAGSLDLLVTLAPDELDSLHEDAGISLDDAIAWLETGESDPCDMYN